MVRDLTVGNPLKGLLRFSFPFVLANLLQQAYNLADMMIVGRFVGTAGLAAVSAGGEIAMFFMFISMGVASAAQVIISQHIGAGNRNALNRTIGTVFTFEFLLGVGFTVISLLICDWAIGILNVQPEALDYAHQYTVTYLCGTIPVFGYNVVSSILRGMGDSKRPFFFVGLAAVLNVFLDLLFVGPLGMACFGAALATILSQTISFVVSIVYLYRRREAFGFDFRWKSFRLDSHEFRSVAQLGVPLVIQHAAISISMIIINSYINRYGVVYSAATAIGNKITIVMSICTNAMMTAGNSIVAQNFAAKKFRRVSETLGWILLVGVLFAIVLSLCMIFLPEQIFALFDTNPEVLKLSHVYAPIAVLSFFGFATRSASFSLVNGIGFSSLSFFCGFLDGIIVRIGLSLLLGLGMGMGVPGFWLGHALAGHSIGVLVLIYYLSGKWKERKPLTA